MARRRSSRRISAISRRHSGQPPSNQTRSSAMSGQMGSSSLVSAAPVRRRIRTRRPARLDSLASRTVVRDRGRGQRWWFPCSALRPRVAERGTAMVSYQRWVPPDLPEGIVWRGGTRTIDGRIPEPIATSSASSLRRNSWISAMFVVVHSKMTAKGPWSERPSGVRACSNPPASEPAGSRVSPCRCVPAGAVSASGPAASRPPVGA